MPTDNLIGLIVFEAPGAGVPTGHVTLAIQHVDRAIRDRFDEKPVPVLGGVCGFEAV
jgi:hypothetical protein